MDEALLREITIESVRLSLLSSLPMLGAGMVVGFIIAIFQATTSIQEQTLTFIPKIIAIVLALVIFGDWIVSSLINFSRQLFELIPAMALPIP